MGQYYRVYMRQDTAKETVWRIDGGIKLMEHSWHKNSDVNTVMKMLLNKPQHLIWMGDYADSSEIINNIENGMEKYKKVWGEGNDCCVCLPDDPLNIEDTWYCIVNHTKRQYLDLFYYISENIGRDGGDKGWCIHPLSLLTAAGNGAGGGDYWGINQDKVGIWADDLIEVRTEIPFGYESVEINFREGD